MRCNPWRWLWGLIPMAMLSWITFHWERGNIEADLMRRSQETLGQQGLGWAVTGFSGRDAVLQGRAADEGDPKRALEAVRGTWGVRVVDPRTDLMPKADVYTWLAAVNKGKLVLSGHVPSEGARKSLRSVAEANFPKLEIEDAMQLARGSPPQDVWLGGASFALRQLAQLQRGTADLNGTSLSISGEALDAPAYKSVRTALGKLPPSIKLGTDNVTPAVITPFDWTAKLAQEKLVLAGHVPNDRAREALFALATKKFGKIAIVDRMEVAGGAPDGWTKAAAAALDQLSLLEDGAASTRGAQFTISGMAADQATAEGIRKNLRTQVPGTFKIAETIEFRAPPAAANTDYNSRWKEAEARWAAQEATRPPLPAPEDTSDAWWKNVRPQPAVRPAPVPAPAAQEPGGLKIDSRWAELELRWSAQNDDQQRRRAEEEARRVQWLEHEARWAAGNENYARQRLQDEEARRAVAAVQEVRKVEADKCQVMMRDVVKNGRILFNTGSADLDAKSAPTLNELVKVAGVCPNARIEISGHTDTVGDANSNKLLSEKRAQAIVAYLAKVGLNSGRMSAVGYGQTRPVAPNDTAANKAKNRRIEFTVVPN